jgi:hypothetical protein
MEVAVISSIYRMEPILEKEKIELIAKLFDRIFYNFGPDHMWSANPPTKRSGSPENIDDIVTWNDGRGYIYISMAGFLCFFIGQDVYPTSFEDWLDICSAEQQEEILFNINLFS